MTSSDKLRRADGSGKPLNFLRFVSYGNQREPMDIINDMFYEGRFRSMQIGKINHGESLENYMPSRDHDLIIGELMPPLIPIPFGLSSSDNPTLDYFSDLRDKCLLDFRVIQNGRESDALFRGGIKVFDLPQHKVEIFPYENETPYPKISNLSSLICGLCSMKLEYGDRQNNLFVLLGLSGSGKSSLIDYVSSYLKGIVKALKVTTREFRPGEEGVLNVSERDFDRMSDNGDLLASYSAFGDLYGFLKSDVDHTLEKGQDLFFDTSDIHVAEKIREMYPDNTKIVYVHADEDVIMDRVVRRYSHIPDIASIPSYSYSDVQSRRLLRLERSVKECDEMRKISDYDLESIPLIERQQKLRDYILGQRFPDIIR